MRRSEKLALTAVLVSLLLGALVAAAGSDGSSKLGSVPVFAICAALAFAINMVAFIPAYKAQTERYYDITGTGSYLSITAVALAFSDDLDARAVIVAAMVAVWALRLGLFLLRRVIDSGGDVRFDVLKTKPWSFLQTWTLQGLWVLLTAAAALAIITSSEREPFGVVGIIGVVIWVAGLAIEALADQQKKEFRADPSNQGRFISTGLWAWSRHPNYFGEIVLWTGMAIIAVPILSGWRWAMLISPVFVYLLLTRISGVPLLESSGKERWGDDPEYQAYLNNTPVLFPKPPRTSAS